ncbi:peptidase M13 [Pseudoxanthomonas yeongjuensis]|uniref:M13 family metallopeptidase n=1 Tax=Pseudoxanthomonas yeongjuensis TaxID=377616 RepID=UPI001391AF03|nr:M13 family metallopeptidase [Pseudoxanthomonas yeongjuensis]KAF1718326.1 peptidase M13 [Pseudoxanthomonas yeongjuensis]
MPHLRLALSKPTLLALALLVAFGATDAEAAKKKKKAKAPAVSAECSDFYTSANDAWFKANPLPSDIGSLSVLGQLRERSQQQQKDLLDAAMQAPQGNVQKLLGDFWASGLDEAAVEADGAKPIAPLLDRINGIKRAKDVPAAIAALHQVGIPVVFNFSPDVDLKALDRHIGYFSQGGLGLPDPAYYTRTDAETQELLGRYRAYVKQILALTGTKAGKLDAEAAQVIDLETRIAQASRPLLDLGNPLANYVPVATKDLAKPYKNLQLDAFLKAQGVNDDIVSLANPALFAQLNTLVASIKPDQWKTYLRWQVGDAMAPYLAKSYRDASFEFRGRVLRGEAAPTPRWQQVLDAINTGAGPMLGREYAARYLPSASKSKAESVAQDVRDALVRGIERNSWMSAPAKAEAKSKIDKLKIEIGTPRRDLDYSVQPMGRGSFGSNILIASTWRHREEMKRIGKGNADRRWDVLPQQPALAYDLAQNRLIVTAAVLQAPVFDVSRGDSALYGSYGALVGHELSRGFDKRGRMVDASGEIRDWWTPADLAAWEAIGMRVAAQYAGYDYPGVTGSKVNGNLTRDENMADLAGVELAWDAFTNAQLAPNLGAKQTLFRTWSELWAQQVSPAEAAQRVTTDVHAPGQWRSNGPLANQPAFGESFTCKAGQPMRRSDAEQIRIWR